MECDRYPENGQGVSSQAWACGVKRKLGGGVRMGGAGGRGPGAAVLAPRPAAPVLAPRPAARRRASPRPSPRAPLPRLAQDAPFMSSMDEITFWIVTKRAPCLAGYGDMRRPAVRALRSASPIPESKKKKRRLIENVSETTERPNTFLKTTPAKCNIISSEKSDTLISDVDFNIKNSSVQAKNKKRKNQKNSRTTLHKKNKVVTSTPNVTMNLRRSLRKAQCNLNNNSHFNTSFEIFNVTTANGIDMNEPKSEPMKYSEENRPSNLAAGDQNDKKTSGTVQTPNNGALNGQFEDLSDVSGFTANYIKSTKINSKTSRKIRTKSSRNLTKESRHTLKGEKSLIVSINKAMNTGDPTAAVLNCSTDSSQNIINLMSLDKDPKNNKSDKSISLLKFIETKKGSKDVKRESRNEALNMSFQSTSTTGSRYPKRHKNSLEVATVENSEKTDPSKLSSEKKRTPTNNNSNKSIGPENTDVLSRTRSGRSIGLSKQPTNSVFVLSNTTEQVSSEVTINMANQVDNQEPRDNPKKKQIPIKCARSKKTQNKTGQSSRDSFREKSGFAACFSDSDDDKPLKPQKYLS